MNLNTTKYQLGGLLMAVALLLGCSPRQGQETVKTSSNSATDSALEANRTTELPSALVGTFERVSGDGIVNELNTVTTSETTFNIGDEGQTLQGNVESIVADTDGYTISLRGDYHMGQDSEGAIDIPDSVWSVSIETAEGGLRVTSVGSAHPVDVSALVGFYRRQGN